MFPCAGPVALVVRHRLLLFLHAVTTHSLQLSTPEVCVWLVRRCCSILVRSSPEQEFIGVLCRIMDFSQNVIAVQ